MPPKSSKSFRLVLVSTVTVCSDVNSQPESVTFFLPSPPSPSPEFVMSASRFGPLSSSGFGPSTSSEFGLPSASGFTPASNFGFGPPPASSPSGADHCSDQQRSALPPRYNLGTTSGFSASPHCVQRHDVNNTIGTSSVNKPFVPQNTFWNNKTVQPSGRSGSSSSSSSSLSFSSKRSWKAPRCVFCYHNGEEDIQHHLKNSRNEVVCPVLRAYRCRLCGATGSNAHTIKYCPENPYTKGDPVAAGFYPGLTPSHLNPLLLNEEEEEEQ